MNQDAQDHFDESLQKVLAAYLRSVEQGQSPDQQQLIQRHPDLAAELRSFFANRAALERVVSPLRNDVIEATIGLSPESGPAQNAVDTTGETNGLRFRYFGDYEILEELGRGGMGVVYKARQTTLNRCVALKTILAGQLASEADVRRFRAEAEAAAALDHPHILPIYEVGEHQGQHYFSMKLVAGGSLAQCVPQLRDNPRKAVQLLVQVARAVHFAHQRGVLHRDLKPGNVLLDSETPYVADFGLAKRVEGDSSLTASGAIVGSPSYMPPEQARAEKSLTVAVDVYALGAILYELLSGRPPFRGDSPLETLLEVLEREPEPLRRINPAIARDLDLICAKCLVKEPAGRYHSAAELADDLDRWLVGEAVSACAPTRGEQLARWSRRNPVQLALVFSMILGILAAAFFPSATATPLPRGVLVATFLTGFMTLLMVLGRNQSLALEKRLFRGGLLASQPATADRVASSASVQAISTGQWLRAVARGGRNGAFLGIGATGGLLVWPGSWNPLADPLNVPSYALHLRPEAFVAALAMGLVALLTGSLSALSCRILLRPRGDIAWGFAWFVAGGMAMFGTTGIWHRFLSEDLAEGKWYRAWLVILAPLLAVGWDWWTRLHLRITSMSVSSGQISVERGRVLAASVPPSNEVIKYLPVLVTAGTIVALHWVGSAIGRRASPADVAAIGADLGALLGRVSGAPLGMLLTLAVLHFYQADAANVGLGQDTHPYPYGLAALYMLATAVLATALWLWQ